MRYYVRRAALLAAAAMVLLACSSADTSVPGVIRRDSAGVRIVINDSAQHEAVPWIIADTASLSVGDPGSLETFLPAVTDARVLSDGRVAVAEAASSFVRVFRANGDPDFVFGGAGSGVGRFRSIGRLWLGARDTILVASSRDARIHVLSSDGVPARTITLDAPLGVLSPVPIGGLADGAIIAWSLAPRPSDRQPSDIFTDSILLHRFDAHGAFDRTLLRLPLAPVVRVSSASGGERDLSAPLHPFPVFAVSDSLILAGTARESDLMLLNAAGDVVRRIRWRAESPRVTAAMRDSILADLALRTGLQVSRLDSWFDLPDHYPHYETALVDDLGYIWVAVVVSLNETSLFDIFLPDGRWLGRMTIPTGLQLLHIGRDFVLGVRHDANAGDRVQRHALKRGEAASR